MDGANITIIEFFLNKDDYTFSLHFNIWVLLLLTFLFFIIRWIIKYYRNNKSIDKDIIPIKIKYKIGGAEIEYQIVRNYQNVEIAYKIYIELITRKAAIEIEKDKDVIIEVYNSWYSLFQITRDELKSLNGKLLKDNKTSKELIRLLTDILNKGLRPHLTEYQAKFRKWYSEELEDASNKGKTPQQIQLTYSDFNKLMDSMSEVNKILIDYSELLLRIISGSKQI
jgi:hypothetical protein